jgi:hypothetical protein
MKALGKGMKAQGKGMKARRQKPAQRFKKSCEVFASSDSSLFFLLALVFFRYRTIPLYYSGEKRGMRKTCPDTD